MLYGVDASFYQGDMDFYILETRINFIFINGGIANTPDPKVERNVSESIKFKIPYGLYFAPRPSGSTGFQKQAQSHANTYKQYGSQIYPALDLEVDGGMGIAETGVWFKKYLSWFMYYSGLTYSKIITYTSFGWFEYQMPLTDVYWQTWLWLADWTPPPNIPSEWDHHNKDWLFWQTGIYKPATDYGCPKPPYAAYGIDIDQFNGDAITFEQMFGVKPHIIDGQPPVTERKIKVTVDTANIRNKTDLTAISDVGDLKLGSIVPVENEMVGSFYQLKSPLYVHNTVVKEV